jgi:hypothetical protein
MVVEEVLDADAKILQLAEFCEGSKPPVICLGPVIVLVLA